MGMPNARSCVLLTYDHDKGCTMTTHTFEYRGRSVEVVSIDLIGNGHGFGLKIDGATINRSGYDPLKSDEAAVAEGVRWAKDYIDSLP